MVSAERIELPSPASEAGVLPLDEAESYGASGRGRTCYAMLFRHALYQLSYGGKSDSDRDRTGDLMSDSHVF